MRGRWVLLAWIAPAAAGAQGVTSSLEAGVVSVRFADAVSLSATTLSPTFSLQTRRVLARVNVSASQLGETGWSRQGSGAFALYSTPSEAGVFGEVGASFGGSRFPDGASTAQALAALRLHRQLDTRGAWVGASAGSMYDGAQWRSVRQAELGATFVGSGLTLTLVTTPSVTDDTLTYTDFAGIVGTSLGRLDITASLGARAGAALPIAGGDARTWGGLGVSAWLTSRSALTIGAGTYPVDVTQGFPAGRYLQVGMRVGATRSARAELRAERRRVQRAARAGGVDGFEVIAVRAGEIEVRVRAIDAARVDVMGDLTQWRAVALEQGASGWWTARFRTEASSTELAIRVDWQGWVIPPGAVVVRDEFGGESGRVPLPRPPE